MTAVPAHVHGPRYVRPADEDRGRCTYVTRAFGQLVVCDSNDIAASRRCLVHYLADRFGMTETEAAQALADYYAGKAIGS